MSRRTFRIAVIALVLLGLGGAGAAEAQSRFTGYRGANDEGWFLNLEALYANVRNTDSVVATGQSATTTETLIPDWDDELTGRISFGRKWASGNRISLSIWNFDTERRSSSVAPTGTLYHYAIGPPIPDGAGGWLGTSGFRFDVLSAIEARTLDLAWARDFKIGDGFIFEWSLGARLAGFEESYSGQYDDVEGFDPGSGPINVAKRNEAEMWGGRLGLRGTYFLSDRYSVTGALAWSFLDGSLESSSSLSPTGLVAGDPVPGQSFELSDDSRSGSIRDFDVAVAWHSPTHALSVSLGWEQSTWEDLAADMARNFPGSGVQLRDRDSVSFSSFKLGLKAVF